MRIGALNVGLHHDIGRFCAQLAENNINDVVGHITYIQINYYVYVYAWLCGNHIFLNTCRLSSMTKHTQVVALKPL
jgi:hypothetical protein